MDIRDFQEHIRTLYSARDSARGMEHTFMWFVEEVGELAEALRKNDRAAIEEELADVVAWANSVANLQGLDMTAILQKKYGAVCHYCKGNPCTCTKG